MSQRLPLNALQAFETAARFGSFADAAKSLRVSAAAVSQHVRLLEARFAKQLFFRRANGVELTDAGRDLFFRVSGAFSELSEAEAQLRMAVTRPKAVISVIASLGELWLLPKLAELAEHAGVQIIEDDGDPIDFSGRGVDIRITYGAEAYPDQTVNVLFHDRMMPVAAPSLAAGLEGGAIQASDSWLIHTNWGPTYSNPQSWATWHEASGSPRRPDVGKGLSVDRLAVAAIAARQGLGIALLPETLAAEDLRRGTLAAMGAPAALMPQPYVMIARPGMRLRPGVEPVWRHLLR